MTELVNGFTVRKMKSRVDRGLKRPTNSLHLIVHHPNAGDCKQCRPKLMNGKHGRRTHWKCESCQLFLCIPECYNKHIQLTAIEERP